MDYAEGNIGFMIPTPRTLCDNLVPYLVIVKGMSQMSVLQNNAVIWIAVSGKGVYVLRNGKIGECFASGDILKGELEVDMRQRRFFHCALPPMTP